MDVGGISVFVREQGDGEPIVMLHGIPTTSLLWKDHIPRLAAYGRAIAPDLPGYGRSDKPPDAAYTPAWYADFVLRFVDSLGSDRISILCHDLGGIAGLAFAADHPERIRRLVVFNTSIYPEFRPPGRVRVLRNPLLSWSFTLAAPPKSALRGLIAGGFANRNALTPEVLEEFHSQVRDRANRVAQLRFFRSVDSTAMRERYRDWSGRLSAIEAPTLVVWGARDRWMIPLEEHGRRLARGIPGAELIALDAKHFVPLDAAEAVAGHLERFFASPSRG